MATEDDAIPGPIEEDLEIAFDLDGYPVAPVTPDPPVTTDPSSKPDGRSDSPRVRLTAHTRPTGQISTTDLDVQVETMVPGRTLRITREMEVEAVDALRLLSRKDAEEIENLEQTHRASRRPRRQTS